MNLFNGVVLGLALLICGCNGTASPDAQEIRTLSSTGSATVPASGGAVEIGDPADAARGARVEIPASALAGDTLITLGNDPNPPAFPAEATPAGPVVIFTPDGQIFGQPVIIILPFDPSKVTDPNLLVPLVFDEASGTWNVLTSLFTVDMASAAMRLQTTHFCRLCVANTSGLPVNTFSTGFVPSQHGFSIPNRTNCVGMAYFAAWYYEKTASAGCGLYQVDANVQESIAEQAQGIAPGKPVQRIPAAGLDQLRKVARQALLVTGKPQVVWIPGTDGPATAHDVLAIGFVDTVSPGTGLVSTEILFYDSNVPGLTLTGADLKNIYGQDGYHLELPVLGDSLFQPLVNQYCDQLSQKCQGQGLAGIFPCVPDPCQPLVQSLLAKNSEQMALAADLYAKVTSGTLTPAEYEAILAQIAAIQCDMYHIAEDLFALNCSTADPATLALAEQMIQMGQEQLHCP